MGKTPTSLSPTTWGGDRLSRANVPAIFFRQKNELHSYPFCAPPILPSKLNYTFHSRYYNIFLAENFILILIPLPLRIMIDLHVYNKIDPKKGRLLITEPFEESSYFNRSVILLCEHNTEGSFGFVLNNYTTIKLTDFEGLPDFETKIGIGGPVNSKNLYYIHTLGDKLKNSVQVAKDLYAGGDFQTLKYLISEGLIQQHEIRFFLGYSGWVDKQLDSELKQNAWLVAEIGNVAEIMDTTNTSLWSDYMSRQGGKYKAFAHFPKNPALN